MDDDRIDKTMIVEITDTDASADKTELALYNERADERAEQRRADKLTRPRLPLGAKLIALWNFLFEIVVGIPFIFLMAWVGDDFGAGAVIICALIFAAAHTAGAVISYGHYKRKYGVVEWKYVLLNALPALILGVATCILLCMTGPHEWSELGTVLLIGIPAECFAGYSVVYCALLFAALGIRYKIKGAVND